MSKKENKENIEKEEKVNSKEVETNLEDKKETKANIKDMVPKQDFTDMEDRYKRILAEFENFKKRSSKERDVLYSSITGDIIEAILPIIDNLENALKVNTSDENYKQGVELVLKQFKDLLKSKNVEEIVAEKGTSFDPELHEAVSSITDSDLGEKEIAEEYRKGYKIGNKVIRHSMVVVAN